jgi:hypothetical protein
MDGGEEVETVEPGLVAVGFDSSGVDPDAAVWTSPDGVTWTKVPDNGKVLGGEGAQTLFSVFAGGPGLVLSLPGGVG